MQFIDLGNYNIFYINDNIIIKKDKNILKVEKNQELVDEVICPPDYKNFNIIENSHYICLFFVRGEIILYDKNNYKFILNKYPIEKYGIIVSKIIHNVDNLCLFVTNIDRNLQVVQYDFFENSRIFQTKSWKVNNVSDFYFNEKVFVVFDQTMLIAFDFDGQINQKFDPQGIKSLHINKIPYYISNKKLKNISNNIIHTIQIDELSFDKILGSKDNLFYMSDSNKKDIFCIDTKTNKQIWNMVGSYEITASCLIDNTLVIATTNNLLSINVKDKKVENIYKVSGIYRLLKMNKSVICQHSSGNTFVLGKIIC